LADWVLSRFSDEEKKEFDEIFEKTRELLEEKI
jgi:peptidyl-tRNA hydrolase